MFFDGLQKRAIVVGLEGLQPRDLTERVGILQRELLRTGQFIPGIAS